MIRADFFIIKQKSTKPETHKTSTRYDAGIFLHLQSGGVPIATVGSTRLAAPTAVGSRRTPFPVSPLSEDLCPLSVRPKFYFAFEAAISRKSDESVGTMALDPFVAARDGDVNFISDLLEEVGRSPRAPVVAPGVAQLTAHSFLPYPHFQR